MGGFLYFIPKDVTRVSELAEFGLGYAFDRVVGFTCCPCRNGPGGVSGTVVGDDRGGTIIGYYPSKQTWRKAPESYQGAWAGFYNASKPGPSDLLRPDSLTGHLVRLGDGNEWMIPVARGARETDGELRFVATVPRSLDIDEQGRWISGGITPRYRELWELACRFFDAFTGARVAATEGGAEMQMRFDELVSGAVAALGSNYRIQAVEAVLLGLLDDSNCGEILRAVIDWPVMEAYLQKKTAEAAS